ncbi:MAG: hypothetical protein JNN08_23240, partial [Bryobacterales bacterium]|nr:hypothetical protein [Bryobacterales bacterium]
QFPGVIEREPNDPPQAPQAIKLAPQVIHGYLKGRVDIDVYRFEARAGERWTFDIRSLEYGSHLECELSLEDDAGKRVAFNDDRDDYLETPFLEHKFTRSGSYRLKVDQYRGPQQVDCSANCGYMLQISQLPVVLSASPMGGVAGTTARVRLHGRHLENVRKVYLTPVRLGEYYRLTFPFTMPLRARADRAATRVEGKVIGTAEAEFALPASMEPGLWRLWVEDPAGVTDSLSFEVTAAAGAVDGSLDREGEEDSYDIDAEAGKPLHFYTLATQLGLPYLDTVLELFDGNGKLVAEHDDLMTGQGTVIGNPDSSLYYTPSSNERLRLVVRDRINRGGETYSYRLHQRSALPGFQLQTDPEEFRVFRGQEAELSVLLIPEPGFKEVVEVWAEGLPPGLTASKGQFRGGQYFGPSDDGDNVIIPDVHLKFRADGAMPVGEYPIRIYGRPVSGGAPVEAFTTLWIGPPGKRNDVRRPLPAITVNVVDAPPAKLSVKESAVRVVAGAQAQLAAEGERLPEGCEIRMTGLPPGVNATMKQQGSRVVVELTGATAGSARAVLEAKVDGRWVFSNPVTVTVAAK